MARQHHQQERLDPATRLYKAVLASTPSDGAALNLLGVVALQRENMALALSLNGQALSVNALSPAGWNNRGVIFLSRKAWPAAAECCKRALILHVEYPDAQRNLGMALAGSGRSAEAMAALSRALGDAKGSAESYYNLGVGFGLSDDVDCAAACYRRAITIDPEFVPSYSNLGVILGRQGCHHLAIACYRQSACYQPELGELWHNLGAAVGQFGRPEEATSCFTRALHANPRHPLVPMSLIMSKLYRPGTTLGELADDARDWRHRHVAPPPAAPAAPKPPSGTEDRPRLGFLSADFRKHAVGYLLLPALEALRRRGFHVVCYSNSLQRDELTSRFEQIASTWRMVFHHTDAALAERITADGIDILFDLGGFTSGNRLLVFAGKPAPLQVSWLGFPGTTGLDAMDYLIADDAQIPRDADIYYREKIIRLPHSYACFQPQTWTPLDDNPPQHRNGYITFGSFNDTKKLNDVVIKTWSEIINLTGGKLILKAPGFSCQPIKDYIKNIFLRHGPREDQLTFLGRTTPEEHMAEMGKADIALDPFPYSGGQTTLETLWMGLPVITLPGETFSSRHSLGYLSTLGLDELVATDISHYIALAGRLATDHDRLAFLRTGMRQRILSSPLGDPDLFVDGLASGLQKIWGLRQSGQRPRPINMAL